MAFCVKFRADILVRTLLLWWCMFPIASCQRLVMSVGSIIDVVKFDHHLV